MIPVVIGFSSAIVFGTADFFGGLAARRITPLIATWIAAGAGLALMLALVPLVGGVWSSDALGWGALGGGGSALAILLLYAALAIGPMSILSPLTAIICAIVPLGIGLAQGERLSPVAYAALSLALVAILLVAAVPGQAVTRPSLRGVLYAIGSGTMMGLFISAMDQSPVDSGLIPLLANRLVSVALLGVVVLISLVVAARHPRAGHALHGESHAGDAEAARRARRLGISLAVLCGLLDSAANSAILYGLRIGELSIMSVLVALYPAGTVILAAIVLRERVARIQWIGLALAVVAAALLSIHRELSSALGVL